MEIKIKKKEFQKLFNIACTTWKPKLEEKLKPFIFEDEITFEESFFNAMRGACTEDQLKIFNVIFKSYVKEELDLFKFDTYSKVCKQLKEKEESCPYRKIKQIERFFNGSWKADKLDTNQRKYYPYFIASGGGLCFTGSGCDDSFFSVPVAYFKDDKTATFVGKTFVDIYKEL